jgi:hypothetical protein
MTDMSDNDTIQRGVQLAEAGQTDQAREIFEAVIDQDPNNATAWAGLAQLARNRNEELFALRQVLRVRPDNDWATERLAELESGGFLSELPLGRREIMIGCGALIGLAALGLTIWGLLGLVNPKDSVAEAAEQTPTVTMLPTFTPLPTNTLEPTPTDPPPPTNTPEPTPTEEPTPVPVVNQAPAPPPPTDPPPEEEEEEEEEEPAPPPEDTGSCSDIFLKWEKPEKVLITNNYGSDIVLTRIYLKWPDENGKLKEVRLDNSLVTDEDADPKKVTLKLDSKDSPVENRTVQNGKTGKLEFVWKKNAQKDDYETTLTFDNGCERVASLD